MFIQAEETEVTTHMFAKLYSCKPGFTPDPFALSFITECADTKKIVNDGKAADFMAANCFPSNVSLKKVKHHVTMGKLIMSFIGHPLSVAGLYDEVQVLFYPLNHHAGGARKHTTASFPIPYDKLEKEMKDVLSRTGRVTVSSFFGIVEVFSEI